MDIINKFTRSYTTNDTPNNTPVSKKLSTKRHSLTGLSIKLNENYEKKIKDLNIQHHIKKINNFFNDFPINLPNDEHSRKIYVDNELICPICTLQLYEFICLSCGHIICSDCFTKITSSSTLNCECPYCKKSFENVICYSLDKPSLNKELEDTFNALLTFRDTCSNNIEEKNNNEICYSINNSIIKFYRYSSYINPIGNLSVVIVDSIQGDVRPLVEAPKVRVQGEVPKVQDPQYTHILNNNAIEILLDVSGSMSGDPLDKIKDKIINFIEQNIGSTIAIHTFSELLKTIQEPILVLTSNINEIIQNINKIYAEGPTFLGNALEKINNDIIIDWKKLCGDFVNPKLLIISDGQTEVSDRSKAIFQFNKSKDFYDTILVGYGNNMIYHHNIEIVSNPLYYFHADNYKKLETFLLSYNEKYICKLNVKSIDGFIVENNKLLEFDYFLSENKKVDIFFINSASFKINNVILPNTLSVKGGEGPLIRAREALAPMGPLVPPRVIHWDARPLVGVPKGRVRAREGLYPSSSYDREKAKLFPWVVLILVFHYVKNMLLYLFIN